MFESAKAMGGNAIIGFRFATSTIGIGMAEIYAYGTVVVERGKEAIGVISKCLFLCSLF
ncbi:MAG: heavy metal-binding domain-containing protein [Desulfurococcaceae archaeon]